MRSSAGRTWGAADLHVDRDRVAAGVDELLRPATGLGDHQVGVEGQVGHPPDRLDRLPAERDVGHEVAVHHVEVDPVRPGRIRPPDRVAQRGQVAIEDARRDQDAGGAAGRCRRAHGSPTPAGTGSALRSPRRAVALWATSRLAPPLDDDRCRLAGVLRGQLAAGGADLRAAVEPDRRRDAGHPEALREPLHSRDRRAGPRRVRHGVHRDQVDMGVLAAQQLGHRIGVDVGVVDAVDHGGLVGHPSTGHLRVLAGCGDHLLHRPAPVQRHEHVPESVARRVKADRQGELGTQGGQPADPRHHARRAHGDVARPEAEPLRVVERGDGLEHAIQVEERLTHAHVHDVGEVLLVGGQAPGGIADLVHDLRGLEVPLHAQLAGRTERAAHGTAGLGADAQCVALARVGPCRVVHQHRFDEQPVGQAVDGLLREDAVRVADLALLDRVEAERRRELGAQGPWERQDVVERRLAAGPYRVQHLAGPVRRMASLLQPRGQLVGSEPTDARALVAGAAGGGGGSEPEERDHDGFLDGHRPDDDMHGCMGATCPDPGWVTLGRGAPAASPRRSSGACPPG